MGLAPNMNQERLKPTMPEMTHVELVDDGDPTIAELRRALRGLHWKYHKMQMDLLQKFIGIGCVSEFQMTVHWDAARKEALDIINEGERVMVRMLSQLLSDKETK